MAHENAEEKIVCLELRHLKRQGDLDRAVERNNGKRANKIREVISGRLSQAKALKALLGDALSQEIRLDDLIKLYEPSKASASPTNAPPTPGTPNQAETRV